VRRQTAVFLADYAERGRRARIRFPLTATAERALAAGIRRGGREAAEVAWQAWLRRPDEEKWDLLCGPRGTRAMAEAILAAVAASLPWDSRRAIGEFCVRRGVGADDEFWRIELYALTGLTTQLRAADPDGTRLTAVYLAADERRRGSLRVALAEAGEIDLVRTMGAGSSRDWSGLSRSEQFFLLITLTKQQDWPALWRLAQQMPLPQAAYCTQRMGQAWAPDDERERALFTVLVRASGLHVTVPEWADPARWSTTLSDDRQRALHALADRPLSAMRPADLETATWLLGSPDVGAARPFVQALTDGLGVRFGTEVAIGPATAGQVPDDDIGLSEAGREPLC
jgi:hypothetical protein